MFMKHVDDNIFARGKVPRTNFPMPTADEPCEHASKRAREGDVDGYSTYMLAWVHDTRPLIFMEMEREKDEAGVEHGRVRAAGRGARRLLS